MCERLWIFVVSFAVVLFSGCGGSNPSRVTGTVTLDGKPLATGAVTFHPAQSGPTVVGTINAQGQYELFNGTEAGLLPGDYVATVVATEEPVVPTDNSVAPAPPKLLTPVIYGDREKSPLKFSIKPGRNTVDISLTTSTSNSG